MKAIVLNPSTTGTVDVDGEKLEVSHHEPSGNRVAVLGHKLAEYMAKHFPHLEQIEVEKDELISVAEADKGAEQRAAAKAAAEAEAKAKAEADAKELEELRAYKAKVEADAAAAKKNEKKPADSKAAESEKKDESKQ